MMAGILDANIAGYTCYVGMETDLIFNQGVDLPGFASFPLLETPQGRARLSSYAQAQVTWSQAAGLGAILEAPTWMANPDRAAPLGYAAGQLDAITRAGVALLQAVETANVPCLISVNIGPRADAYAPADQMDIAQAQAYHSPQVRAAQAAGADLASGFTLGYGAEAAGIACAGRDVGIPVVISFTVEVDGRLPSGETLAEAIEMVDAASDAYPAYFMINCAHPDHFADVLGDTVVARRVAGLVVNASRCSHAELDEAAHLDDGDPAELGAQIGALARSYPNLRVFGGCCGTDARHMTEIARNVAARTR